MELKVRKLMKCNVRSKFFLLRHLSSNYCDVYCNAVIETYKTSNNMAALYVKNI
jgi:hypothetical protein